MSCSVIYIFFFFNDTATTEIYTLSLHDALPIFVGLGRRAVEVLGDPLKAVQGFARLRGNPRDDDVFVADRLRDVERRSEEHTSELQSRLHLVCRLLLEKKKNKH